jgi:hypothetical protein
MLARAAAIRLSDREPALFTQTRVGKDGRLFKIYKFRTMVPNAERHIANLRAKDNLDGILFKLHRDPRITPIGAWMRRWSLDELPELVNVFLGDMSLVGPRARAAGGGGEVRGPRPPQARSEARPDRPVAGDRPIGPVLGGIGPARPTLCRELVART